jgi:serine-type D-Ala-D-Ala carboxypeptidase (penicillin-binding protein 5/6)
MRRGLLRLPLVLLALLSLLATAGFGPPTLIESDDASTPVSSSTLKQMRLERQPQVSAKAAVIMDATTGQLIYDKNSHAHRAPASTTKMTTALVTLESSKLTDVVTAGPNVKKVEPTIIGLDPGDKLTVEQLLYGLLLPSGNDAAVALAEHVGGSESGFATMMNAKVAQLGLKDTHYVTPHGLDTAGHYSSAYDLALTARAAFKNPVFEKIVSTKEYRVDGPVKWYFKNNNRLLDSYSGADGVKTGYTDDAGRCLAASATRAGHRVIVVVLDSLDTVADSAALLDYAFSKYSWEPIRAGDSPLGVYGQGDELRRAVISPQPDMIMPTWQKPYIRWYFSAPSGQGRGDGGTGTVTYYLFGRKVAEFELRDGG